MTNKDLKYLDSCDNCGVVADLRKNKPLQLKGYYFWRCSACGIWSDCCRNKRKGLFNKNK